MKKSVVFLLLLLASTVLFAQEKPSRKGRKTTSENTNNLPERPPKLIVNLTAAPTCEWLMPLSDGFEAESPKLGARYGFVFDVNISEKHRSDHFYFMIGVMAKNSQYTLFSSERYTIQDSARIYDARLHYTAMHLVIPTGIRLRTTPKNGYVFAGNIGLYNQLFLFGERYDEFAFDENYTLKTNPTSTKDFPRISEAIFAGLGFEYAFHRHCRLSFYVNYVCTVPPFFNKSAQNFEGNLKKAFSHSVEFSLGIGF